MKRDAIWVWVVLNDWAKHVEIHRHISCRRSGQGIVKPHHCASSPVPAGKKCVHTVRLLVKTYLQQLLALDSRPIQSSQHLEVKRCELTICLYNSDASLTNYWATSSPRKQDTKKIK